jgi:hypothetical protein
VCRGIDIDDLGRMGPEKRLVGMVGWPVTGCEITGKSRGHGGDIAVRSMRQNGKFNVLFGKVDSADGLAPVSFLLYNPTIKSNLYPG